MRRYGWCVVLALMVAVASVAQEGPSEDRAPAPAAESDTSDQVMERMLRDVQENPLIEPVQRPSDRRPTEARPAADPRVIGVAPWAPAPKLRREGEFVVNRSGRLVRSTDGLHLMFVFEADSRVGHEPPMILVPCQILQDMEQIVHDRGDRIMFILSGQVLAYRGANYLLPTIMKVAMDRGNLQQ
jgi:hypothetical protein